MSNLWLAWDSVGGALLAKTSSAASQWIWLAVGGLIAAAWFGLSRWNQFRRKVGIDKSTPQALMSELGATHNLSRLERSLLAEAAATRNLHDPALVFVDPRILNSLVEARNPKAAEYAALIRKLFG